MTQAKNCQENAGEMSVILPGNGDNSGNNFKQQITFQNKQFLWILFVSLVTQIIIGAEDGPAHIFGQYILTHDKTINMSVAYIYVFFVKSTRITH